MAQTHSQRTVLILAAHGATDDPRCAAPVHRHAEAIRAMGLFDEVITIFWKEKPFFCELYKLTDARDLLIVPVMTASGYYSNIVLPREVSSEPDCVEPIAVHIAEPIGELPGMTDIIVEQAVRAATEAGLDPAEARLLLIGHGTRRDPLRSGATTYRHAAEVNARAVFNDVSAGFLEQDPEVADAFARIEGSEPIIIVPFLIANGGHGANDIPRSLGIEAGARIASVSGRAVLFADAAGEHPGIVNLIFQSAEQARLAKTKVA